MLAQSAEAHSDTASVLSCPPFCFPLLISMTASFTLLSEGEGGVSERTVDLAFSARASTCLPLALNEADGLRLV